jgi:hypothetical protein
LIIAFALEVGDVVVGARYLKFVFAGLLLLLQAVVDRARLAAAAVAAGGWPFYFSPPVDVCS